MAPKNPSPNPGAERLLEVREKQGTQFSLVFSLAMMGLFIVVAYASAQSGFELLVTLVIIGVSCVVLAVLLVQVSRNRLVGFAGWTLTALYLLVMLVMPWLWYQSVGGDSVPKTYLLKINIMPLMFICLVLTCLPGRPWYPLLFTLGSTAGLLGAYLYALQDPSTVVVERILESVLGPGANLGLVFNNLVLHLSSGLLLVVFLRRFQQTVVQASEAEHASAQLGRYFSPGLVPLIARSDTGFLQPGGRLQPVTILFSDIRGFTTLSEGLAPARVVALLSLYQEQMVQAIFEFDGTLDKFIGDGIMATFGTPTPGSEDSWRAVQAALSMQKRLTALNETLAQQGLPVLKQGIGVHAGPVIAGNVGTASRLEYTVIGDAVNTASLLESLCKQTGDVLLVSDVVASEVREPLAAEGLVLVSRGTLPIKGRIQSIEAFTVQSTSS